MSEAEPEPVVSGGLVSRRWLWPLVAALVALAPALLWQGGVLDEEALNFTRNFWSERTVLQKVFELRGYDDYQGRELSYAIDCLDSQWIRLLLSRGVVLFVAPSVVLASLGVVALGLRLSPRALPRLDPAVRWLVLLLYLANFAVASTTAMLYRATKPLVAPLLLALALLVVAEHREPWLRRMWAFAAAFVLALAMSLLDRQGLFYAAAIGGGLALAAVRVPRSRPLAVGIACAIAAWVFYNDVIGPWAIERLNGYRPEMEFQTMRPGWLLDVRPWLPSLGVIADWTRVLLGGVPRPVLAAAGLAAAAVSVWRWRRQRARLAFAVVLAGAAAVAQLAMVAMMVVRHPPVAWVDHRIFYYPLPYQALVTLLLLLALDRWLRAPLVRPARLLLAGLVLANLLQWPEGRQTMEHGPYFGDMIRRSKLLVQSLHARTPVMLLDDEYRRFFFECLERFPRLALGSPTWVAEAGGLELSKAQGTRLTARAEREAHLTLATAESGRHTLVGRLLLRGGQTVLVLLGSESPREIAEVHRSSDVEGVEPFRVDLDLPAGRTGVVLVSQLPPVGSGRRRAERGVTLVLPFLVWRSGPQTED